MPDRKPSASTKLDRELARSIIAEPLLTESQEKPNENFEVIIELNLDFRGGRDGARAAVLQELEKLKARVVLSEKCEHPFVFATLKGTDVRKLAESNLKKPQRVDRPIYRIWMDHEVLELLTESVRTIKADAARISFTATGRDIVWAVIDSGVDGKHEHFKEYGNLKLTPPLEHVDYVQGRRGATALVDGKGHGTHVAGIIAGITHPAKTRPVMQVQARQDTERDEVVWDAMKVSQPFTGVAPETKILSMRVLDENGSGKSSRIIAAIEEILRINDYGRRNLIHGVNLSIGYWFNPRWFACGQSPICTAVDRLARSGVIVVVAAGNSGYSETQVFENMSPVHAAGQFVSINDPGNAGLAITVGSVHRSMPHIYGVSFFSSKGPTGDGRRKPDLVAPGEKIVSCATGKLLDDTNVKKDAKAVYFVESSGTSMAAPHVSGAVAAFLSIRREFIGEPEKIKNIFMKSATDLDRDARFQGAGLIDLMRAIQSI